MHIDDLSLDVLNIKGDYAHHVRELLEDFQVVGSRPPMAIIPTTDLNHNLKQNVQAALIATTLCLDSVDYARKKYCQTKRAERQRDEIDDYVDVYKKSKDYMRMIRSRLNTTNKGGPSVGVFGASLVLERLYSSFFSAHLLYRLGHEYEGHAIARIILEQLAWAYSSYKLTCIEDIEAIVTTKTISKLKKLIPKSGQLYGYLSKKTHIDYDSHGDFWSVKQGKNVVHQSQANFQEYALVILILADMFSIVWEITQYDYMDKIETIKVKNDKIVLNPKRPFLKVIEEHQQSMKKVVS
jgi:hypothetical protein